MLIALALLACSTPDTADVSLSPSPCAEGFARGDDGNCYPVESVDTGDTGEPDDTADTDTAIDTGDTADTDTGETAAPVDLDEDGSPSDVDCDDTSAAAYPGAPELCDDVDNDCDGETDEEAADARTWFLDADADGHGDPAAPVSACEAPAGAVELADDCDDARAEVHPGAPDDTDDDVDNDCDGTVDEDWDPCSVPGGRVSVDPAAWTFHEDGEIVLLLDGSGAVVCDVSCADAWVSAEVGEVAYSPCSRRPASLPWTMSGDGSLCLSATYPGTATASTTCDVRTSAGTVTVTVGWSS